MTAGLEPAVTEELSRLGLRATEAARGVVSFAGSAEDGARATLRLRSAPRVALDLARDLPGDAEPLREALARLPWEEWLPSSATWAARAIGTTGGLRDTRFVARLVKDAVRDRCAAVRRPFPPVDPGDPQVLVEVRLDRGRARVGLDLGGGSLHARGTGRQGEAPLREDVAAGLAILAGARADAPLLDPFCGTGTLIAEAASLALGLPPRRDPRALPLSRLPWFRGLDLRALAFDAPAGAPGGPGAAAGHAPFRAFDADPRAVAEARAALARQGLAEHVAVEQGRVPDIPVEDAGPGLVLANPPWGLRLDAAAAHDAWYGLGTLARTRLRGWRLALLSGDAAVTKHLGLRAERRYPVRVGGVDARLLVYEVHPART